MSLTLNTQISHDLNALTYNGNALSITLSHQNIYMGLGLWSLKDGLSHGLPVDVMQMLLAAALMRLKIMESYPINPCKVVILIADSMAVREGAPPDAVSRIVSVYRKSLIPLLIALKLDYEILLASDVELRREFRESLSQVDESRLMRTFIKTDSLRSGYIRTQTALSLYMHDHLKVGYKVGWVGQALGEKILNKDVVASQGTWDELRFDNLFRKIIPGASLQPLYARAGLKQRFYGRHVNIREGCPYTSYPEDRRYVIRTDTVQDIRNVSFVKRRVREQWKEVAGIVDGLIRKGLFCRALLPAHTFQKNNVRGTVYHMLNHWVNAPLRLAAYPRLRGSLTPYIPTSQELELEEFNVNEDEPR